MLEALEHGVKGGKWFSLIDKVCAKKNLVAAWEHVRRNRGAAGADRVSIEHFGEHAERYLSDLECEIKGGRYRPTPVRRCWIPKPGTNQRRPLGIPTIRDRVAQAALRNVLEPIFERKFVASSYGYRPGRGCKDALRRVTELLKQGYTWVVDIDIASYFDSIDHEFLLADVQEEVADGRVLEMIREMLTVGVLEEDGAVLEPEAGTPQGGVMSPLLANIYLHPVDELLGQAGYESVRYADDQVVMCRSRDEAEAVLALLQAAMTARKLTLHPTKTRISDAVVEGFEFLGYRFCGQGRWPRRKSMKKLRDTIRPLTRRCNGHSLEAIIARINPILRGWFNYFKHSHRNVFPEVDQWVRMRLRSILRKRHHGRGRGRGADHQRWPNAYFTTHGLFTMTEAHVVARQSH
ncbi:MAG: group II intron reverse transcriptase/maturase [Thermoanaerobaculaceae bacterium]|jgi:RNA-directed DNA polymerase|nr:group II intron reverse transcriptase/maturase [Thermoanaerobaculaceae bacterium]